MNYVIIICVVAIVLLASFLRKLYKENARKNRDRDGCSLTDLENRSRTSAPKAEAVNSIKSKYISYPNTSTHGKTYKVTLVNKTERLNTTINVADDTYILDAAEELGEEIIIANRGVPVAKLVTLASKLDKRSSMGIDRGLFQVPADFNESLPTDLLAAFEIAKY